MRRRALWTMTLAVLFVMGGCAQKQEAPKEAPKAEKPAEKAPEAAPEKAPLEAASPRADAASSAAAPEVQEETPVVAPAEKSELPTFDLAGTVLEVEKFIPDSPVAVAAGDIATLQTIAFDLLGGDLLMLPEADLKALQERLSAYHLEKLGFTVASVASAVVFVGPTGDSGVLIKGQANFSDAVRGETVAGFQLLQLIPDPKARLFEIPGYGVGIYVPAAVELESYLTLVNERSEPKPERLKEFTEMLGSNDRAWFAVAINFAHPIIALAWPPDVPFKRPEKGLIQFTTDGLTVEIEASTEVLDSIDALVNMGKVQGRTMIDKAKAELDHMPVAEGTAIILADAYYNVLFERLAPKRDGNKMRMELTMAVWGATPVIGVLAAVAIPAFLKYIKKSKISEVTYNLDRMKRSAALYFCTERVDEAGNLLPAQFPPTAELTPKAGCCFSFGGPDADRDDACDPDAARFAGEGWQALSFQIDEKHWFSYEFRSNGATGNDAEFTAAAYGDLDCDGIRSTFELTGKGVVSDGNCDVEFRPLYIENELE